MKKTILVTLCLVVLLTSVAVASPLMDYSVGKAAIDLNYSRAKLDNSGAMVGGFYKWDNSYDGKGKWDFAGTIGLGKGFAFQYAQSSPQSKTYYDFIGDYDVNYKLCMTEFTVFYQLNPNISAYTGLVKAKGTWNYSTTGELSTDTKNIWQFGVQGYKKFDSKLTGFASAGVGRGFSAYKIGLGYEVVPNLEINAWYDYKKVKDMATQDSFISYSEDATVKGMKYGITYKF